MSGGGWVARRWPAPPADLGAAMTRVLEAESEPDSEAFHAAARACLSSARRSPGRVRASAFDLLVADALLTYACASALDAEDPEGAWLSLFAVGRT